MNRVEFGFDATPVEHTLLGSEVGKVEDADPGLPALGEGAAPVLDLAPAPKLQGGAGSGEPIDALLRPVLQQLAFVGGEVLAARLDAHDTSLGVEREHVDDPE